MHDGIIRRHAAKDQENDANQWEAHETEEEGVRHHASFNLAVLWVFRIEVDRDIFTRTMIIGPIIVP